MAVQQVDLPEVTAWRGHVEELYRNIRCWATEMDPVPAIRSEEITLVEKWSGPYRIPQLTLEQNEGHMTVRPVARFVVGADGRVDLLGLDGPFTLFLMEHEVYSMFEENGKEVFQHERECDWYWVQDRAPWETTRLDGPLFRDLAESCLR